MRQANPLTLLNLISDQALSNLASVRAVSALEKKGLSEQAEAIDLGKVRAIIRLYFPTCQPFVDARDQRDVEDVKILRDGVAKDPLKAMCAYILVQTAGISKMCNDIRECLAAQAEEIGRSVRDSLAVPAENRVPFDMARGRMRFAIACLVPYFGYWAITGWLAYAALPDYLARSDEAGRQNHWTTSAIWMQAANEADKQVQRSLAWGIAVPIALIIVAGIIYWVYCGFRSKAWKGG